MKQGFVFLSIFFFSSALLFSQYADNIAVPEGYKVEKIAQFNDVWDPIDLAFDQEGKLIVANNGYMLYRVDLFGTVEMICQTRRFNIGPTAVAVAPDGAIIFISADFSDYKKRYIYKFIDSEHFDLLAQNHYFTCISYDTDGNLYAGIFDYSSPRYGAVIRYDSSFNETIIADGFYYPRDEFVPKLRDG